MTTHSPYYHCYSGVEHVCFVYNIFFQRNSVLVFAVHRRDDSNRGLVNKISCWTMQLEEPRTNRKDKRKLINVTMFHRNHSTRMYICVEHANAWPLNKHGMLIHVSLKCHQMCRMEKVSPFSKTTTTATEATTMTDVDVYMPHYDSRQCRIIWNFRWKLSPNIEQTIPKKFICAPPPYIGVFSQYTHAQCSVFSSHTNTHAHT